MRCDRCGRHNPDNLMFCQDCGKRLQSAAPVLSPAPPAVHENICPRCQTKNPGHATFCVACGTRTVVSNQPAPPLAPKPSPGPPPALTPPPQQAAMQAPVQPIAVATDAVVQVAPSPASPAASVTCTRCQGVCDASMRFCKFCGSVLADQRTQVDAVEPSIDPRIEFHGDRDFAPVAFAPLPPPQLPDSLTPYQASGFGNFENNTKSADNAPGFVEMLGFASTMQSTHPEPIKHNVESDHPNVARSPASEPKSQPQQASMTKSQASPGTQLTDDSQVALPRLVLIGSNGKDEKFFSLDDDQIDIGRSEGNIIIASDRYMSPRHARLTRGLDGWRLRDLGSTNGTFLRIREPYQLCDGDLLLLGVEVLRFELAMDVHRSLAPAVEHGTLLFATPSLPSPARLVQRTVQGVARDVYHLHRAETVLGRESGDIVFTDDPYMSKRHAAIHRATDRGQNTAVDAHGSSTEFPPVMTLQDLGSSNGTFVAIRDERPLVHHDFFRVGQHLFRVELVSG